MIKITVIGFVLLVLAANSYAQPACNREDLQSAVDSYLAAQKSGDGAKMSFAAEPKFFENMQAVDKNTGLWNTALPIAYTKSFLDPARCKTFTEVIVTEGEHQYVVGTRLTVNDKKIAGINSLVTDKGDWLFNADAYLKFAAKEDWSVLPQEQRVPAQKLIDAANQYLDMFADKNIEAPWGIPCERLEGGAYMNPGNNPNPSCNFGIPDGVLYIVNRSFVVDEERGVVNVYCRFGNSASGMPDSHTFRLINGKYRYVHTLSVNLNPDRPSPQADENGKIIRQPRPSDG